MPVRLAAVLAGLALLVSSVAAIAGPNPRPASPQSRSAAAPALRFATFNASLNRSAAGQLIADLSTPDNAQASAVAEIIQRTNPDVLLINEFDYDADHTALRLFHDNYLARGHNGAATVTYPYSYTAASNTGVPSGFDLDNSGTIGGGNDAFGFGLFPGQYGMALYSKYPLDTANIRTFQTFLWRDMPDAMLPDDPATAAAGDWFSPEEQAVVRLSSKSHWDVPVLVDGTAIHVLASHPTPPVFDGAEDRNGTRNHDEIRFWADYVTPGAGEYIYDDNEGAANPSGGLPAGARFVIMGDLNADPADGDSTDQAILQLLEHPDINVSVTPSAPGGEQQAALQGGVNANHSGDPIYDTADFSDAAGQSGNLRADYVLPSYHLRMLNAGIFWPLNTDPTFGLVGVFPFPSSDHRLVWVDLEATPLVAPTRETPPIIDDGNSVRGDADDPAIWLHPTDPALSLVLTAKKRTGLSVYDLSGVERQAIDPGGIRYNNIDVQYGFPLGGQRIDIAVASDRIHNTLRVFSINPITRMITDISAPALDANLFPDFTDGNPDGAAYGLALYRSPVSGEYFAFVSSNDRGDIAQVRLVDAGGGKIGAVRVRTLLLPTQVEGMVADQQLGHLYVGEEGVGLWKFAAEPTGIITGTQLDAVYPQASRLKADVEGLTIYYGADDTGYLLASSQGDSTFAVYEREGDNAYLGQFMVGAAGAIDRTNESDGADVLNVPLGPAYPSGLFVTQDGLNDGAPPAGLEGYTNFKFVGWEGVANAFSPPLAIDTTSYNPRTPVQYRHFLPMVIR